MNEHACGFICDEHEDWKAENAARESGLDVERLTTVLHDWMPDGADVSVGFDGASAHLVGSDLARYIFDRAAEQREGAGLTPLERARQRASRIAASFEDDAQQREGADPDQNVWNALDGDGRWADQLSGEHVAHRGNHEGYACGFSGPHCWACGEPWPCRANRGVTSGPRAAAQQREGAGE